MRTIIESRRCAPQEDRGGRLVEWLFRDFRLQPIALLPPPTPNPGLAARALTFPPRAALFCMRWSLPSMV